MKAQSGKRIDNDSVWKDIWQIYFLQGIMFFCLNLYEQIDWSKEIEFLDKELQQLVKGAKTGRKYVDKLVKVWLKTGQERLLLIHIEVQGQKEEDFEERIFLYYSLIYNCYRCKILTLVILTDSNKSWRPNKYKYEFMDFKLNLEFPIVKLLDYQDKWAELENSKNPFAVVIMAHLKALEYKKKSQQLYQWKWELIHSLYEKGYEQKDVRELFRFIDWAMILPKGLAEKLKDKIAEYERSKNMPYVTSIERLGKAEGLKQGRLEGRLEGERALILKLLQKRIRIVPEEIKETMKTLNLEQLELLAEELLDFQSTKDLTNWFEQHSKKIM